MRRAASSRPRRCGMETTIELDTQTSSGAQGHIGTPDGGAIAGGDGIGKPRSAALASRARRDRTYPLLQSQRDYAESVHGRAGRCLDIARRDEARIQIPQSNDEERTDEAQNQ